MLLVPLRAIITRAPVPLCHVPCVTSRRMHLCDFTPYALYALAPCATRPPVSYVTYPLLHLVQLLLLYLEPLVLLPRASPPPVPCVDSFPAICVICSPVQLRNLLLS